ncbi:MAG: YqeG family HAD IIIA-type phosphatase [Bacillota bacterium]
MQDKSLETSSTAAPRTSLLEPRTARWQKLLYPKMYVPSVTHIDPDDLHARGIRCVLFDLDNTVVPRDKNDLPPEVAGWIKRLREKGIKVCVVSNNGPDRIRRVDGMEDIPSVCRAVKPFKHPFRKAMKMLGATVGETAVVGDQIFTDILGGNRLGLYTILVVPMPGKEYWATEMFNRRLERLVLNRIRQKIPLGGRS